MTQQQIDQMFEGRWRYRHSSMTVREDCEEEIKDLCRDFFEAGICLGEGDHCPPSAIVKAAGDVAFDDWWKLYDLKVAKEKCMQKWNKMSVKDREACIAATPAYVAATPDKQFRKRPLTYLNQKAWNDEIIPRNNGTDKPTIEEQRISRLASILTD